MKSSRIAFPEDFLFGAATSAYQIEGAAQADGRGESIWDRFCRTPGKVFNGQTGDTACDHYSKFAEDVALMKQMGLKAYRFSISWPRIFPAGAAVINQRGLDFYSRLVDTLLANDIQPWATLYHWDLPQALQDAGGFANRAVSDYFAEYAATVAQALGDRVKHWMTINEPWVAAFLGNKTGEHAPGLKDEKTALQVAHGLLLAHGSATQAIRAESSDAKVGIALSLSPAEPHTGTASDYIAAERNWQQSAQWFLHPLLRGQYPEALLLQYGNNAPEIMNGDMRTIKQPIDFMGVNYYFRTVIGGDGIVSRVEGSEYTDMGWEVRAQSLRSLLARLSYDYRNMPPIYITESGCAFKDVLEADGSVHDDRRLTYLRDHLTQAHVAIQQGVNLKGYFAWSLLDNFEWAYGYEKRFGLVYTDYATQRRYLKDSGKWYQQMIARGGWFNIAEPETPVPGEAINFEPANATYALASE